MPQKSKDNHKTSSLITMIKTLLILCVVAISFLYIRVFWLEISSETMLASPSPFPDAEITYQRKTRYGCGHALNIVRRREYAAISPIDVIEKHYNQELPKFCIEKTSLTNHDYCPECLDASCNLSSNQSYYVSIRPASSSETKVAETQTIMLTTEQEITCP